MKMQMKMKPQFVYVLSAVKRDANGVEVSRRTSGEIPNVFTNYGVEALFGATTGDSVGTIAGVVGTGSAAPAITDTLLSSFLAGRYTSTGATAGRTWVDNGDGTAYIQRTWITLFPVGVATGNISEVGAAFRQTNPTVSTPLCSRALVLDAFGNPTTFEVLADEELQLTQYFRVHFSYLDTSYVLSENGNSHTISMRPYGLNDLVTYWEFPAAFGPTVGTRLGFSTGGSPVASLIDKTSTAGLTVSGGTGNTSENLSQGTQGGGLPYLPNTKKVQFILRRGTGALNIISWGVMSTRVCGSWQFTIAPPVNKPALNRATITFELQIDNAI